LDNQFSRDSYKNFEMEIVHLYRHHYNQRGYSADAQQYNLRKLQDYLYIVPGSFTHQ